MKSSVILWASLSRSVVPLTGGRGLKWRFPAQNVDKIRSSPSRGTWIEIIWMREKRRYIKVVPLTGDVD